MCRPLFVEWSNVAPGSLSRQMIKNLTYNEKMWKKKGQEGNLLKPEEDSGRRYSAPIKSSNSLKPPHSKVDRRKSAPTPSAKSLPKLDITRCNGSVTGKRRHSLPDNSPVYQTANVPRRHSLPHAVMKSLRTGDFCRRRQIFSSIENIWMRRNSSPQCKKTEANTYYGRRSSEPIVDTAPLLSCIVENGPHSNEEESQLLC